MGDALWVVLAGMHGEFIYSSYRAISCYFTLSNIVTVPDFIKSMMYTKTICHINNETRQSLLISCILSGLVMKLPVV